MSGGMSVMVPLTRVGSCVLVPWVFGLEGVEDGLDLGVQCGWECGYHAVDVDGCRAQGLEGAQKASQRQSGSGLDFAAEGQCGEHDGQVGFDSITGAGEYGPGREVGFRHPEGLLDAPEVVVAGGYLGRGHERGFDVGDIAFEPDHAARPLQRGGVEFLSAVAGLDKPRCAGRCVPGNDRAGLVFLQVQRLVVAHRVFG